VPGANYCKNGSPPAPTDKGTQGDGEDGWADGVGNLNDAYNTANSNPYFWGWQPFYNVIDTVLQAAQSHGLNVTELDIQNEVDLVNSPVQGRLLMDNVHLTWVLDGLGWYMEHHGFSHDAVTVSVVHADPYHPLGGPPDRVPFDCVSAYGDSATLLSASALFQAISGGPFGVPNANDTNYNLYCGGSFPPTASHLAGTYNPRTVLDIHSQSCFEGPDCTNTDAQNFLFYNSVWSFLSQDRGGGSNYENVAMVFGESNPLDDLSCIFNPNNGEFNFPPAVAVQAVLGGYKRSTLFTMYKSNTTFRPWHNPGDSCYQWPLSLSQAYDPFHQ
jgi:hypothetical protein